VKKQTLYIILAIIVIGVAALVYYQFSQRTVDLSGATKESVKNETVGLSFAYVSGDIGFSLIEPPIGDRGLLAAYVLIPTKEYQDFKNAPESGEAPASVSVLVYSIDSATSTATTSERLDRVTRLQNWAIDNNILTSFNHAKATPDIVEIDGIKALHYQADGLYQQNIYLVSYRSRAYMFVGQYDAATDITNTAFEELIKSVSFD
jgi:hypothetical protein